MEIPDFKIKGTPMPKYNDEVKYSCVGWPPHETQTSKTLLRGDKISFGYKVDKGVTYIKCEREGYTGSILFFIKESILIDIWKENMEEELELPERFAVYFKIDNRTIADHYNIIYGIDHKWLQFRDHGALYYSHNCENNWKVGVNRILPVITEEQLTNHIKKMRDTRFPFTLNRADAQCIIGIACGDWKGKLKEMWSDLITQDTVEVTEIQYNKMRIACSEDQHRVFDEIFGKDKSYPKDGTPCLVSQNDKHYKFAYANGEGGFYMDINKSGATESYDNYIVLDADSNITISR